MLYSYSHFCCLILFQLQDLAVIPGLRDPRLNFAESVIEGHTPGMNTTGRSYLRVVLWFSFLSPMLLSPFLYLWVLQYLKNITQVSSLPIYWDRRCNWNYICCGKEEPLIRSVTLFCCFLLLMEFIFVKVSIFNSTEISRRGNISSDFYVVIFFIPVWLIACLSRCLCSRDLAFTSFFSRLLLITCTSLVSYHFIWVAVGIMVNPAWGVSILLLLYLFFISIFFIINQTTHARGFYFSSLFAYTPGFLGICFAVVPPLLVGQSFNGRETADDILKAGLLSVLGVASWLYFKPSKASSDTSQSIKAAMEAAAAARALTEKISVPQPDGTGVYSTIAAATTVALSAAATAVGVLEVALVSAETENSKTKAVSSKDEISTGNESGMDLTKRRLKDIDTSQV